MIKNSGNITAALFVLLLNVNIMYCQSDDYYPTSMKCDKKGNIIEEIDYPHDYYPALKYTFKYDKKGNVIEKREYDLKDSLRVISFYKYFKNGKLKQEKYYDSEMILSDESEYKYDKFGNYYQSHRLITD